MMLTQMRQNLLHAFYTLKEIPDLRNEFCAQNKSNIP